MIENAWKGLQFCGWSFKSFYPKGLVVNVLNIWNILIWTSLHSQWNWPRFSHLLNLNSMIHFSKNDFKLLSECIVCSFLPTKRSKSLMILQIFFIVKFSLRRFSNLKILLMHFYVLAFSKGSRFEEVYRLKYKLMLRF